MKRTADFAWIVVFSLVAQLVLSTPGPTAATAPLSASVTQPTLGLADLVMSAPDTAVPFVLPSNFLFPISGARSAPVLASRAAGMPDAIDDDSMWSLPATSRGDTLSGPSAYTDESGLYRFVGLPKGTHKVTIDLATLPLSLRPDQGADAPVLWITPGMDQVSRALPSGVRFTAVYERESGDVYGAVGVGVGAEEVRSARGDGYGYIHAGLLRSI